MCLQPDPIPVPILKQVLYNCYLIITQFSNPYSSKEAEVVLLFLNLVYMATYDYYPSFI